MSNESCRDSNPSSVEYKFPWDSKPEDRTTPLKCQYPKNRNVIRKDPIESVAYIGELISDYINTPENIQRDSLRDYISSNKIKVSNVGFYDSSAQGVRPVIYIKYAGMKSQQDFAMDNSFGYNIHNAVENFYCKWILGLSVYVIANSYTESLALAEEVRYFLHYYQLPIKRSLCWEQFQVVEAQAPAHDETFDCYTTTISCTATFGDNWYIQEAAPLLKKATLNTSL